MFSVIVNLSVAPDKLLIVVDSVQIADTVNSRYGGPSEHVSVIVTVCSSGVRTKFLNFSVQIVSTKWWCIFVVKCPV